MVSTTTTTTENAAPDFWSLEGYDIVIIPSMTVSFYETKGFTSIHEERHLTMLNLLKNTNCRIIFVISSALEADIVKYRLSMYSQAYQDSTAEQRLVLLEANDASNRPLTEKILENKELIEDIRKQIRNPDKAIMLSYVCSPLDEKLRNLMGIKYWFGSEPCSWGTKSGSRQIFKEGGIPIAEGLMEPIYEEGRLETEILALQKKTGAKRIIVKLDDGSGGYGNVVLNFSALNGSKAYVEDVKRILRVSVEELLPFESFVEQVRECGVIIEQMIDPTNEAEVQTTPSVQLYISDRNKVQVLSSHEQVIEGCFYLGCRYPASADYLDCITAYGKTAGEVLSQKGVRGFCGVDFLVTKKGSSWDIVALEINLRLCATTFSYFSLLTVVDESLVSKKHYIHLDEVLLSKKFTIPELTSELERHNLQFNFKKGKGILLSTLSTLQKGNEVGLMCIGDSIEEVDVLQKTFMREMDATVRSHTKTEEAHTEEGSLTKPVPKINEQGELVY